jgi:hypothetical protein
MLVLNHKVDLDAVVIAPRLPKMAGKTGATHRQSMVEDNQLAALSNREIVSAEGLGRECARRRAACRAPLARQAWRW